MTDLSRFAVVLVRPDSPENIGLAARGMANTGFDDLRLVGLERLEPPAWRTAIHADHIIERARFYPSLAEAVADREIVLGSTARVRHDFPLVPLDEAAARVAEYPGTVRVGLVFGNERTGLTQAELGLANIRFHIPQAARQPSYNLGVAVTLTLHAMAFRPGPPPALRRHPPSITPPRQRPAAASATCSTASASCTTPTGTSSPRRSRTSFSAWP